MKVLVACEFSGIVREAFRAKGHDAWSCDLVPTEIPGQHIQGNVLEILDDGWDMMIAHPPCTHLSCSGAKHFSKKIADGRQQQGIDFFMKFTTTSIPLVCIENPIGIMSRLYRKPDQIIQPWQFGHEAQKSTCLWLKGLPKLCPTNIVGKGDFYVSPSGKKLPVWYGDASLNGKKIGYNTEEMKRIRNRTFKGVAEAMAEQWSKLEGR